MNLQRRKAQTRKKLVATASRREGRRRLFKPLQPNRRAERDFFRRGGMTERYEKSPVEWLGILNGTQSIPTCKGWLKSIFFKRREKGRRKAQTRKKLVATASRREGRRRLFKPLQPNRRAERDFFRRRRGSKMSAP